MTHYRQVRKRLVSEPVNDSVPNFFAEIGAFEDGQLAGTALLGGEVAAGVRQVALLYVSRPHRGRGVATALMDEMERLARAEHAHTLYVSSVPTGSAVGFYLSRGFRPTDPLPEPFAKEPDDIHMLLHLADG